MSTEIDLSPESAAALAAATEASPTELMAGRWAVVVTAAGRRVVLHRAEWPSGRAVWRTLAEARAWIRQQRPDLVPEPDLEEPDEQHRFEVELSRASYELANRVLEARIVRLVSGGAAIAVQPEVGDPGDLSTWVLLTLPDGTPWMADSEAEARAVMAEFWDPEELAEVEAEIDGRLYEDEDEDEGF